jgi:hypothetical protein
LESLDTRRGLEMKPPHAFRTGISNHRAARSDGGKSKVDQRVAHNASVGLVALPDQCVVRRRLDAQTTIGISDSTTRGAAAPALVQA